MSGPKLSMTPKAKRKLIDLAIMLAVVVPIVFLHWWLVPMVVAFGLWNFYDGQTRSDLPDE